MPNRLKLSPLTVQVASVLQNARMDLASVYLVGGSVRDALLGLPSHDLDFVLEKDSLRAARMVADGLGGAYFTMDAEFQVGRVVLKNERGDRQIMDFTAMQGESLEDDLRNRDFTVNAIAISLAKMDSLIDPLGGVDDLFRGRLRVCSDASFLSDPVRVLRAVRMSAAYQLAFQPETRALISPAVADLWQVSVERVRDEFLKIMDAPRPDTSLRILDRFEVLEMILPETMPLKGVTQSPPHIYDVWEHSLHAVAEMEHILNLLDRSYKHDNEVGGDLVSGLVSQRLGRYRENISQYVDEELVPDRPFRSLMMVAALFHDITKPAHLDVDEDGKTHFSGHEASGAQVFADRAAEMRLSNAEIRRVKRMIEGHGFPWQMSKLPLPPTRKAIYQFWNVYGDAGVGICLLSLADTLAVYGHTITPQILGNLLDVIRPLLEAYWENPEQVEPPTLIDGNEIMETFNLMPGPQVGELLSALREAQAVGEVNDRREARAFLEAKLSEL